MTGRTGITVAVAIALCSGAAAVPADAASAASWTVRAPRTASGIIVVPTRTDLLLGQPGDRGPVVRIVGGGTAAGFLLTPLTRGRTVGQLAIDGEFYGMGGDRVTLAPGRYRLRVLAASGPVTVTIPATGPARRWTVSGPLASDRVAATWDMPAGPLLVGGVALRLRAGSVALFRSSATVTGSSVATTVCLTTAATGSCAPGEPMVWHKTTQTTSTRPRRLEPYTAVVVGDDLPAGSWAVRWRISLNGVASDPAAIAYVVG